MPTNPITAATTDRRVMDRVMDKTKVGKTTLRQWLFPSALDVNLYESSAQIDVSTGMLGMAPFVKSGTAARMVELTNGESYTVETPNINLKRPLEASSKLSARVAGGQVFTSDPGIMAKIIRAAIEGDAKAMNILCDNREEWMVAMLLRGSIEYSVEGNDSFIIDTGKPLSNTYQVPNLWNGGSAEVEEDLFDVKALVADANGPEITTAICGVNAAAAIRALLAAGSLDSIKTDSGVAFGAGDLRSNIQKNGMVFLGRFAEIDFYQYRGKFTPDDGGEKEYLIRDDYIEYVSLGSEAQVDRKFMYGLIMHVKYLLDGSAYTDRLLVSKEPDEDQGVYEGILKTRPFPWLYSPEHSVSQKVV
jgi:hypothetical protein